MLLRPRFGAVTMGLAYQDVRSKISVNLWTIPVTDPSELPGNGCPKCHVQLNIPPKNDSPEIYPHRPVRMTRCQHILCAACMKSWIFSDNNNHQRCQFCWMPLQPYPPIREALHRLEDAKAHMCDDADLHVGATTLLKAVENLLGALPPILRTVPESPGGDIDDPDFSFTQVAETLLWTADSIWGSEDSVTSLRILECQRSYECLRLACERLKAFMHGDFDQYRAMRKRLLWSYVHVLTVYLKEDMTEFLKEMIYTMSMED
jgi:uncharacterized CHY-type Zn-finger protein